ncbi:MAG: anion transporter [Proteobacteria bacterium]|nr:anion transporter [Pseudomonadota bacterium]
MLAGWLLAARPPWTPALDHAASVVAAALIFLATFLVIALGKLPGFHLDRAGAALLGASLMIGTGVLSLDEAYRAIDFDTIALLLGMMIVVANLRLAGFFRLATAWVAGRVHRPVTLLMAIVLLTGCCSAFLVNDAVCLVMAPLVLELVARLGRAPVPYLLAVAMASNAGSVATMTGNPQNMIIGALARVPYGVFAATLSPVAVAGLVLTIALIALAYRREFFTRERLRVMPIRPAREHRPLIVKAVLLAVGMVALFCAGAPIATVALVGGALLLVTRSVKADKIYRAIDWPLLVMFAGLFVVIAGIEKTVLSPSTIPAVGGLHLERGPVLALVTAGLSNLVSNVPAVLVLKPFVAELADPQRAWLAVAMISTLAGNLTLVGSVANLIVARCAETHGTAIGFWEYAKVGAPLTMLTVLIGMFWLR